MYGPRTFHSWRRYLSGGKPFKRERRLLPCDDCFLGMCLFWKPSYYLIQSSCCNQIFTRVLPYHGSDTNDIITRVRAGERPSLPIDPSQNRWLQDPVWDTIKTGWHGQPKRRCKLSVMYRVFSPPSQRRQLGKILPQIASFFKFLQNSESEIQRQINEMNGVSFSSSPPLPLKADTTSSISRTMPSRIGSD